MITNYMYIKYLTIEDKCPECGKLCGTNMDKMHLDLYQTFEAPENSVFSCKGTSFWCEDHGEWFKNLEIKISLLPEEKSI